MSDFAAPPLPMETPRIMGLETEYTVMPEYIASNALNNNAVRLALHSNVHSRDTFLSNGGRFYIDHNNHPEYATPECLTGHSVAIASAAGEIVVSSTLGKLLASSKDGKYESKAKLFKRTIDSTGTAAGDHENYYMSSSMTPEEVSPYIVPHLISRIIFTGPGMIRPSGNYSFDQRTWVMDNAYYGSGSTSHQRPFILNRKEPHSRDGHRLQVLSGSANMMGQPLQFRFDSTSLVLRLIEHNMIPSRLRVRQPGEAMRMLANPNLSDGLALNAAIRLTDESLITAPQLQYEYAKLANKLGESGDLNDYDAAFARRWVAMSQDAVDGKIDKWKDDIEWMVKQDLLAHYASKRSDITIDRLKHIDLKFHELPCVQTKTIQKSLKEKGRVTPITNSGHIKQAVYEAPDDTRARSRGQEVMKLIQSKRVPTPGTIDWQNWPTSAARNGDQAMKMRWLQKSPYSTEKDFSDAANI